MSKPSRRAYPLILVSSFLALAQFMNPAIARELDRNDIPVRVDERVELLSIVFRLIDAFEYHMTPATEAYAKEVDRYFAPFKDHEALAVARKLRSQRQIGFDAVAWFAVHIEGGPRMVPKVPFDKMVDMDGRWSAAAVAQFLNALQRFADDSKAFNFFKNHQTVYRKSADRLAAEIAKRPYRAWLDQFFGARPGADFCAIVGMLNGSANYGVKVRYPNSHEEILPIIGASRFDQSGLPVFDASVASIVAHEFCHSYCNPLIDRFADSLLPSAKVIFPEREVLLKQQAYSNAQTMLYESLVRACTHRFLSAHGSAAECEGELRDQLRRGFYWNPDLSMLLREYEASRQKYASLEAFMPRIVHFFEQQSAAVNQKMAMLPHIKRLVPPNRAADVDPAITELRMEFDRAMRPGDFALRGRKEELPAMPIKGHFDDSRTVFVQPIKLEPGRTYRISINSIWSAGFTSADGLPLDPVEFTFKTAKR
jgi:hypothetical protein